MDPKDLRANALLSLSVSDDTTKYAHSKPTLPANKSKTYHETISTTMGKVDATTVRPCAIIGPDRVLPQISDDVYLKKTSGESWPCAENAYRQPPDYPNRLSDYPPIRNISPRQTFQENMQRIMVPPTYSSIKNSDEKNTKSNMPQEAKYCDVPYNVNSVTNEPKSVRNSDIPMSSINPAFGRNVPHYGWPAGVNIRPPRPYGAPEMYQYPEYPSCVGPRPAIITHPQRINREEAAQVYSERLYQEANIRFKPYPVLKEKQQTRYDYVNNYQNTFHPPVTFPPHKYDLQKSLQTHPYPVYPQVPLKYLDRRIHESFVDGYQRSNQQPNFHPQFHNQVTHPPYGPISGNCVQNKSFTDLSAKPIATNKLPYESNNKIYLELDTSRNKGYPIPENIHYNDTNHPHLRNDFFLPNRSTINMHSIPQHQFYRRDNHNLSLKQYEYNPHYRTLDQSLNLNYSLPRLPLQYSPNTFAISPSDSNTSNDTTHTIGTSQEDCGYVSQSSTNSVRSLDTMNVSAPKDVYKRHNYNIHAIPRNVNSFDKIHKNKINSSSKKNIDVRQFLQMWNEGEDETNELNKEIVTPFHPSSYSIPSKTINNQEQLYVLGLVNVPNEELSKYEHIQKISKLPENIKGYNSIELLNQYEELLESPNNNNYKVNPKVHKDHNPISKRSHNTENNTLPRPVSPLDVEAKISQSVIHKEVGCNFEIKPCSPEMLNAEVATPIQSLLGERIIEKVANPMICKSPILARNDDSKTQNSDIRNIKIASCDMINKQYPINNFSSITKNKNYTAQDFESNSGVSFASLPRLDNDIELNFPEINQQFIKANKIETDAGLFKNDLTQVNTINQTSHEKTSCQQQSSLSPQVCLGPTLEKEFCKLSKYRKSKKCELALKEDILERNTVTTQQRINSVIIKNPDTKLQDETDVFFSTPNKTLYENVDNSYNTNQDPEKILSSIKHKNNNDTLMSFDQAIDFSLNKTEILKSYDSLNKCTDELNYFSDSHSINFNSKNIVGKEVSSKEQTVELHPNQVGDHDTVKEPIEHLKIETSENSVSVAYKQSVNDLKNENNIPVIKNTLIITEIEEHVNVQKNDSCIVKEEEMSLLKTSTALKLVDEKKIKSDETEAETSSIKTNEIYISLEKEKETQVECVIEIEKDNMLDEHLEKYDDVKNEKVYSDSVANNQFYESREFPNTNEVLIHNKRELSLNTTYDNCSAETETSTGSNKKSELKEVLDEIEKNDEAHSKEEKFSKLADNLIAIETEYIEEKLEQVNRMNHTGDLILNNQMDITNKTNDDDYKSSNIMVPKMNEYTLNVCIHDTSKSSAESSTLEIYNTNSDSDTFNSLAYKNSTVEVSEYSPDENFDCKKIITSTNNNVESLKDDNVSTNKENENMINNLIILDNKLKKCKTHNLSASKKKRISVAKELYSPWIQNLITFREGICANIIDNANTKKEKLNQVDILLRDADKEINDDVKRRNTDVETSNVQNNLIVSENNKNDVVQFCCDSIKSPKCDETNKTLQENNSGVLSEDVKKINIEENPSITPTTDSTSPLRRNVLKRSLSESALEAYSDENIDFFTNNKRKKRSHNIIQPIISEDLCRIIQTNRRNSISTFYNEDDVFILIDNDLIITEENDESNKMYYAEMTNDIANTIPQNFGTVDNTTITVFNEISSVESNLIGEEKSVEESWVEDVACIETVVSDDITDDIDYEVMSPKTYNLVDETVKDQSGIFCDNKHIEKIKNTYGSNMCSKDTEILQTLYMTPQMNVNKTLLDIESHSIKYQDCNEKLDPSCNESNYCEKFENEIIPYNRSEVINEKENINTKGTTVTKTRQSEDTNNDNYVTSEYDDENVKSTEHSISSESDYIIQSPKKTMSIYSNSSSPEVSSTTSEEKNSSILLKITNHNGTRISKANEIGSFDGLSYKLTEKKEYQNYSTNFSSTRTLITKAAQKYIPPLKESIRDLKIKLTLPQHHLHKLKQLKISKVEPKIDDNVIKYVNKISKQEIPKKPKPKFEDVLKSIDEIQFKKHKVKKGKNAIPKVVIKKNCNGKHFASCKTTNDEETYNPDLTGRKWQPWVFLEKNNFIDKMAIKNKVKAVYCHRKNNYVLAENFRKYKSIYNANFVISQPSSDNSPKGALKYTIKLKHK